MEVEIILLGDTRVPTYRPHIIRPLGFHELPESRAGSILGSNSTSRAETAMAISRPLTPGPSELMGSAAISVSPVEPSPRFSQFTRQYAASSTMELVPHPVLYNTGSNTSDENSTRAVDETQGLESQYKRMNDPRPVLMGLARPVAAYTVERYVRRHGYVPPSPSNPRGKRYHFQIAAYLDDKVCDGEYGLGEVRRLRSLADRTDDPIFNEWAQKALRSEINHRNRLSLIRWKNSKVEAYEMADLTQNTETVSTLAQGGGSHDEEEGRNVGGSGHRTGSCRDAPTGESRSITHSSNSDLPPDLPYPMPTLKPATYYNTARDPYFQRSTATRAHTGDTTPLIGSASTVRSHHNISGISNPRGINRIPGLNRPTNPTRNYSRSRIARVINYCPPSPTMEPRHLVFIPPPTLVPRPAPPSAWDLCLGRRRQHKGSGNSGNGFDIDLERRLAIDSTRIYSSSGRRLLLDGRGDQRSRIGSQASQFGDQSGQSSGISDPFRDEQSVVQDEVFGIPVGTARAFSVSGRIPQTQAQRNVIRYPASEYQNPDIGAARAFKSHRLRYQVQDPPQGELGPGSISKRNAVQPAVVHESTAQNGEITFQQPIGYSARPRNNRDRPEHRPSDLDIESARTFSRGLLRHHIEPQGQGQGQAGSGSGLGYRGLGVGGSTRLGNTRLPVRTSSHSGRGGSRGMFSNLSTNEA